MSNKEAGANKRDSVVAIAQSAGLLQAVEVRGTAPYFQVLWTQSGKDGQADWGQFAADCGLATGSVERGEGNGEREVVAGFSSAGVIFSRIEVPAAARADADSIVRLQAESRLPLSVEQMEIAWRAGHATNGQLPVTMAAARTDHLRTFVDNVKRISPSRIMLDAEGIVKVWRNFFGGDERPAVILSAAANDSQLCLVEYGSLVNAVALDMGADDFAAGPVKTEATERYVRDVRSLLEMFGCSNPGELRIIVLSDGSEAFAAMTYALNAGGLNAATAEPDVGRLAGSGLDAEAVYDYRLPIGLGLIALEEQVNELNIFKRLYSPVKKVEKKKGLSSLARAAVLAGVMFVLFLVVSYAVDAAKPGAMDKVIAKALADKEGELDMKGLIARQGLRKAIAAERPDMLHLIKLLDDIAAGRGETGQADKPAAEPKPDPRQAGSDPRRGGSRPGEGGNDPRSGGSRPGEGGNPSGRDRGRSAPPARGGSRSGIKLQEVNFKKGAMASVSGEAPGSSQIYKFVDDLRADKNISDTLVTKEKLDSKTKKYNFTIEFKYKTFSEKKSKRK